MTFRFTLLKCLIYAAMAAYAGACVGFLADRKRLARVLFMGGFGLALGAFALRWEQTGHVPLQNLFEVFLCLGMLAFPLSCLWRRLMCEAEEGVDALLGLVILFPAGFVFSAEPQKLPPALQSWLFAPHVGTYLIAYMVLIKAAVVALKQILADPEEQVARDREVSTYRAIRVGFPLLTIGLILGAWWGKKAWGGYWNWDPKELWALGTWLVYAAYLHVRGRLQRKLPRLNSSLALLGAVFIVLTLLWVNLAPRLFGGLHTYAGQ